MAISHASLGKGIKMDSNTDIKDRLVSGNNMFRKSMDPAFIARLSKKHEPFVAILACSDSRVSPEKVFDLSLGDAFVVRVAGNRASDSVVLGSLEYAVSRLNVKALLVLGHTSCGAVNAVLENEDPGNLMHAMQDIGRARYKTPTDQTSSPDSVAESNVRLQLRMLEVNSRVIMDAVNGGKLTLLGAMLDLSTGTVSFV